MRLFPSLVSLDLSLILSALCLLPSKLRLISRELSLLSFSSQLIKAHVARLASLLDGFLSQNTLFSDGSRLWLNTLALDIILAFFIRFHWLISDSGSTLFLCVFKVSARCLQFSLNFVDGNILCVAYFAVGTWKNNMYKHSVLLNIGLISQNKTVLIQDTDYMVKTRVQLKLSK